MSQETGVDAAKRIMKVSTSVEIRPPGHPTTKHTKATKVSEIDISKPLNFVFFVPSW